MAAALPGPAARRGRAERRGARGGRGHARDDRARVPGRAPGPAAAPARGADRPRRPRLAGQRDRRRARHQRRGGQQRAAAGPGHDAGAPAGAARPSGPRGEPSDAERGAAGAVHRRRTSGATPQLAIAIAAQDIRITMPPYPALLRGLGRDRAAARARRCREGDWRLVPTVANRMPTAASYLRAPGDTDVPRVQVRRAADRRRRGSPRSRRSARRCSRPPGCLSRSRTERGPGGQPTPGIVTSIIGA